jgi:hypothetical protein
LDTLGQPSGRKKKFRGGSNKNACFGSWICSNSMPLLAQVFMFFYEFIRVPKSMLKPT